MTTKRSIILSLILLLCGTASAFAQAALDLTEPSSNVTVQPCDDYFSTEWYSKVDGNLDDSFESPNEAVTGEWLFNLGNQTPASVEMGDVTGYSYSGGAMTTETTGNSAFIRLLTPESGSAGAAGQVLEKNVTRYGGLHPIDSSHYRLLTFRMYSEFASSTANEGVMIRWDKAPGLGAGFSPIYQVYQGWHTYQIDLGSLSVVSGQKTWANGDNHGLAIYPFQNKSGVQIKFDWLHLTPATASCESYDVEFSYSGPSTDYVSLFIDTDSDPTNGYQDRSSPLSPSGTSPYSFSSSALSEGQFNIYGLLSNDYATQMLDPWDMNSTADIISSTIKQMSVGANSGISGGQFCFTTTGTDPSFRLETRGPIDTAKFHVFSVNLTGIGSTNIQLYFLDSSQSIKGMRLIPTTGNGTYSKNLADAANTGAGESGTFSGDVKYLRFDPGNVSGRSICITWAALAGASRSSQPSIPAAVTAPADVIIDDRSLAPVLMPDKRGGRDYFTVERGNPLDWDGSDIIDATTNLDSLAAHPGDSYQDNAGNVRVSAYVEGYNVTAGNGNPGDPSFTPILRDQDTPLDASRYKITCFDMNLADRSILVDHTVLRIGWEDPSFNGYTTDDVVIRTVGTAEYCLDLSQTAIEQGTTSVQGDFYTGAQTFRIDPYELEDHTKFRIGPVRLAADHEADDQFAIVVGGDRVKSVSVYRNTSESTSGGTLIGTLGANRSSDVLLWDTSGLTHGTKYYIYTVSGDLKFLADGPVVINHNLSDTEAPQASLLAPAADGSGRYDTLDIAGWAVDNVRIAAIEAFLDGTHELTFWPDQYNIDAKDQFPNYPFATKAGFQKSLDLARVVAGSHTLRLDIYDSSGNKTTISRTFTKAGSSLTSPEVFDIPAFAPVAVDLVREPYGTGIAVDVSTTTNNFCVTISNIEAKNGTGSNGVVRLKMATKSGALSTGPFGILFEGQVAGGGSKTFCANAKKLLAKKGAKKKAKKKPEYVYIAADHSNGTPQSNVVSVNAKAFAKDYGKTKTIAEWMSYSAGKVVPQ